MAVSEPVSTVIFVEGVDLATLGLQVSRITGWRDGVRANWPRKKVPGRWGAVIVSSSPEYDERTIIIDGTILGDDLATVLANWDEVKWRLSSDEQEYIFVDDVTRVFNARAARVTAIGIDPHMTQTANRVRINLLLADPRIRDDAPTIVSSIGAADKDLPLGTAPSFATINVVGTGSFTLTYKDSSGATVALLTMTGATSPVDIDMETQQITDGGGNAIHLMTSGGFFAFDPADGDYSIPNWPTLRSGAGDIAAATYTKAYL